MNAGEVAAAKSEFGDADTEERLAWDMYAAAVLSIPGRTVEESVRYADMTLRLRRTRFGNRSVELEAIAQRAK